ncbi:MAG: hypothetical protein ABL971_16060 [Vicinamibacterales bacterium]
MVASFSFRKYGDSNIAEHFTQPSDYFQLGDKVDMADITRPESFHKHIRYNTSMIVIGGGGIYGAITWKRIRQIVGMTPPSVPIVFWGMGINDHGKTEKLYGPILTYLEGKSNVLIGLRDINYKTYVPCASCMREEFDWTYPITRDVVYYAHQDQVLNLPYPTLTNRTEGNPLDCFRRVVAFLGSADSVVTNTYHGAFWATLLGRKVIVACPFSNKFYGLKYEPVIVSDEDAIQEGIARAASYPDALEDGRSANRLFYRRVREFAENSRTGGIIGTAAWLKRRQVLALMERGFTYGRRVVSLRRGRE